MRQRRVCECPRLSRINKIEKKRKEKCWGEVFDSGYCWCRSFEAIQDQRGPAACPDCRNIYSSGYTKQLYIYHVSGQFRNDHFSRGDLTLASSRGLGWTGGWFCVTRHPVTQKRFVCLRGWCYWPAATSERKRTSPHCSKRRARELTSFFFFFFFFLFFFSYFLAESSPDWLMVFRVLFGARFSISLFLSFSLLRGCATLHPYVTRFTLCCTLYADESTIVSGPLGVSTLYQRHVRVRRISNIIFSISWC